MLMIPQDFLEYDPSIAEEFGYDYLWGEFTKDSDYYFYKFEHPEIPWNPAPEEQE